MRGYFTETRARLDQALSAAAGLAAEPAARAWLWAGIMATEQHDFAVADRSIQRAIEMARELGDRLLEATALEEAGRNQRRQRRLDEARRLASQALEFAKQIRHEFLAAKCEFGLAVCDLWSGVSEGLRQRVDEAMAVFHRGGFLRWEASALNTLGVLAYFDHDLPASTALYEQAMGIAVSLGDASEICRICNNLAGNYHALGDFPRALQYYSRMADVAQGSSITKYIISASIGKAEAYLGMKELDAAAGSIEQAQHWIERYEWPVSADCGSCLRVSAAVKEARGDRPGARAEYARAVAALREADQSSREELELAQAGLERLSGPGEAGPAPPGA